MSLSASLCSSVCLLLLLAKSVLAIDVAVDEELPVGSVVVRLMDYKATVYNNLDPTQAILAILDQNTAPANYFKIEQNSGVVSVAKTIDREEVCDRTETCKVRFNVAVQSLTKEKQRFSTVVNIQVFINDVNDNSPSFPAKDVTLDISEGAKVGTEIKISGAVDRDTKPEFTVRYYNISPPLDEFSIRATSNIDGSSTINLRLESELDREMTDLYMFNIVAYDGGPTPRSDFLKVKIRVTDDNDNSPVFVLSVYNFTVNETEAAGTVIGQVTATDKDAGQYGEVRYSFSQASEMVNKGTFAIHPTSGQISLVGDLRKFRRSGSPFVLYVDAKDGGEPPRNSQTMVSIFIKNTGNEAPVVKVNTVTASDAGFLAIPETAAMDWFVAYVDVEDTDEGEAGIVDCKLMSGSDFKLDSLSGRGYTILLNVQLDREVKDSHQITVSCQDKGNPPMETQVVLIVNVTDVNDNAPEFDKASYEATVDENRKDQYAVKVTAKDTDMGPNADITYSLSENVAGYLKIHQKSGLITTSTELDRERNATLQFTVFAVDTGDIKKTGSANVVLYIRDANDNSPRFNRTTFDFSTSELTANNTIIGELLAYDLDTGLNGQFDFFLGSSTSKGGNPLPFNVLKNGSVLVSGALDREMQDSFSFLALVRDRGEPSRSSSVTVGVKVTDENDNDPVILFPTSSNHTIAVTNIPESNIVLGQIIAFDADEGINSDVRFYIYGGNTGGAFAIGATTGELVLQDKNKLINPSVYNLSIKVEDASKTPRNTTTHLRIEVNYENVTGLSESDTSPMGGHYILIVGIIGGATFILSVVIISAIIFILHSEAAKRRANDGSLYQNKFLAGSPIQAAGTEKVSNDLAVRAPSNNNSSIGKGGSNSSPPGNEDAGSRLVNTERKCDEVTKKVSFSLNIQDDQHYWIKRDCPDKAIMWDSPSPSQITENHKAASIADDSDASLDSAPSDSGKGTSDEENKFDSYLATRGQRRPLYHSSGAVGTHPRGDMNDFTKYSVTSLIKPQTIPVLYNHTSSPHYLPSHSPQHGPPSHLDAVCPTSCAVFQNSSFGHRQGHFHAQGPQHIAAHHGQTQAMSPMGTFTRSHLSADDDRSSTSGSYVINQEDASFDELVGKDLVV
ncbi:putative protocadherin beta-18 [Biomphalaria glabrata]|uniref:Protocadherin beta-18 n=1 Tax=Biomphalaria glabrata TaxID=6526 RepID=A0A9W3B8D4_BIOGL|nr:putative protocadherin beta-18 [Biomphalaria glabrata]XP_055895693.1 putative protocadherin beta-18 [Biomphalaria glabrata]XP_055895694.1 putative protocadherin beta-18 [Biomphalaria glabrata]XP_055895695.1 putative protocadherin beta-18 [Biomphalaria glabrata]XP_055895696.1 putative protocadherin beta-18 [Biomphalaria glabrata]XP_055895697.1 putative protocadherin beta-18 [Biomphalaria glabrata]XP_055895698.1 putative protocadherin beta-18 [Biomphalaria glabrata]